MPKSPNTGKIGKWCLAKVDSCWLAKLDPQWLCHNRPILPDKHHTDVSESSVSMISQLQSNIAANFDHFAPTPVLCWHEAWLDIDAC